MISIIIPTFNEVNNIKKLVTGLLRNKKAETEIIVSDGGSTDNTREEAIEAGAKVIICPEKGRAAQMNYGAAMAKGYLLYFVHADTYPPESFPNDISDAIQQGFSFGRYRTRFDSNKKILHFNAFFTRFDLFICYGGDQTLFITKELFDKIGGFKPDMLIMEDYEIITRAKKYGLYKIIQKDVLVSARKYANNSWLKVQMANYKIVQMYKKGKSQEAMINRYKKLLNYL